MTDTNHGIEKPSQSKRNRKKEGGKKMRLKVNNLLEEEITVTREVKLGIVPVHYNSPTFIPRFSSVQSLICVRLFATP